MWLPCIHILSVFRKHFYPYGHVPIYERWLAEYNLPIRRLMGPQLRPFAAASFNRHYKALHHVPGKLHDCNNRTAVTCFNNIIDFASKIVVRAKAILPSYDFPMGLAASGVQLGWVKKPKLGLSCEHSGNPVQTYSYWCDADQLTYHSKCMQMVGINECPFYGKQLQHRSPAPSTSAIVRTSPVIMENKSRTPPTTDVDLGRSADSVPPAHGPKTVRIYITCND
ncbi:hypothetical protein EG68_04963 [Paragonimus skrjabini miyazakii]|uniref:Uncharacterized protein n=1 Tax=Paragonimus skrjabini miyazakii TaxID=59628 RepID=A0A8S9YTM9_9TREM|nr:hypothetical protein EG68_04963 [Paragonimus skrjabini miyazakii]